MKDGLGDGSVRYTKNNDMLHLNRISEEEKGSSMMGTAHAVSCTKTSDGTLSVTFDSLQKGRNCVFETNNQCCQVYSFGSKHTAFW